MGQVDSPVGTGEHRPSDRPSDRPRARPEARPGRLLRTIARHWPILVVLLLAVALRVVAWYAVHPSWWILGDSIGYLDDAIHLQPDRWRPSGYSFLLLRPLLPAHHLSLVTAVQHLLGLGVGVLVYATLLRLGLHRWTATVAAVPALLDGYFLATEQMLASETLFTALVTGGIALILWRAERPPHVAVAAAGVVLALAALTRLVGLALVAPAVLVLLVPRPAWTRLAMLGLGFALPISLYLAWFDHHYGQPNLTASSGIFLYGRTTQFVACDRIPFSDERLRQLCPSEPIGSRNEVWYVFDPESPLARMHLSDTAGNDLAGRFAAEALRAQPGDYAALTWEGVVRSFQWDQRSLPDDMRFDTYQRLPNEARAIGTQYEGGGDPRPVYRPALIGPLAAYQAVAHVPATVCLLALLLSAAGLLLGRDPERRGLRPALALTAGAAFVLLMVPALTAIVAPRYRVPAIPALCIAVAISGQMLAQRVRLRHALASEPRAERLLGSAARD